RRVPDVGAGPPRGVRHLGWPHRGRAPRAAGTQGLPATPAQRSPAPAVRHPGRLPPTPTPRRADRRRLPRRPQPRRRRVETERPRASTGAGLIQRSCWRGWRHDPAGDPRAAGGAVRAAGGAGTGAAPAAPGRAPAGRCGMTRRHCADVSGVARVPWSSTNAVNMTDRRFFNARERAALYLAADGKCMSCGAELEPGWHADHVDAYSRGGVTDVTNGQALCPTCNLMKGNKPVSELRAWQAEALEKFLRQTDDYLCVATPGAGKTRFALSAAQRLMERGEVQRVIVVVPTSHLRTQWAKAAHWDGIQLDSTYSNSIGALARDFDGTVITYAAVASAPLLYRKLTSDARTLVILDEIHHAGETRSSGARIRMEFEPAVPRLALSGTPFRSDGTAIPFVRYDAEGRCLPSYVYDYGTALADGDNVVRQIEFPAFDGEARWLEATAAEARMRLSDTDDATRAKAMMSALSPDGDWIPSVLRQADARLTLHREQVPDAGGLVVAADQFKARKYAAMLAQICGEEPTLAISDEPDASRRIAEFAAGSSRWIVAVAMVSEGVDIPRLAVGVYATNVTAELFFRQVVGRFVR